MHYLRDVITKDIYKILFRYKIEMVATFIPGKVNKAADFQSRHFRNPIVEWSLHNSTMELIHSTGWFFDIDLFASFLNNKHSRYVSWHRDPFSCFVDAFKMKWMNFNPFIQPPFSLIQKCFCRK